jgi:hypothetical protein
MEKVFRIFWNAEQRGMEGGVLGRVIGGGGGCWRGREWDELVRLNGFLAADDAKGSCDIAPPLPHMIYSMCTERTPPPPTKPSVPSASVPSLFGLRCRRRRVSHGPLWIPDRSLQRARGTRRCSRRA